MKSACCTETRKSEEGARTLKCGRDRKIWEKGAKGTRGKEEGKKEGEG
jgi:hypothetical protein